MNFSAKKIGYSELKLQPWKNGGGVTREIAISPETATPSEAFLWRLSTAEVSSNGAFSNFPGYRRVLTLVEGKALILERPETADLVLKAQELFEFSGDEAISARLAPSAVRDFNLIYEPSEVEAQVHLLEIKSKPRSFQLDGKTCFLFVASGEIKASLYPGEKEFFLGQYDTLKIDVHTDLGKKPKPHEEETTILLSASSARLVFVELNPKKRESLKK